MSMPVSTSLSSPSFPSARFKAVRLSGARPRPNRWATAASMPRRLRYSRAAAPERPFSCSLYHLATSAMTSVRLAVRSACSFARGSGAGTSIPALAASSFTASMKGIPRLSVRKRIASPCAPQPKQWENPLSSLTVKLGVFSLWNGQQAFHSRPARISFTVGMITLDSVVRARSSSSHCGERVTNSTLAARESPARRRNDLSTGGARRSPREYLTRGVRLLISNDSFHVWNESFKVNLSPFRHSGARSLKGITREGFDMLMKIGGLARALYVILAIIAGFVVLNMMNVPLVLVVLGLIAGLAMPRDKMVLAGVVAIVLPIVGTALGHIPNIGAQLTAVTRNLQLGVAGALATAIAILLYELIMESLMGLTASGSAGAAAAATR